MLICDQWFHACLYTTIIRLKKKDFEEIKKYVSFELF